MDPESSTPNGRGGVFDPIGDLIGRGPHTVTVVTPVVSMDRYGAQRRDYGDAASRRPARGWLQQQSTGDLAKPERAAGYEAGLVFYTHTEISSLDRVEQDGRVYEVDGDVYSAASPSGAHHWRVPLRLVEG